MEPEDSDASSEASYFEQEPISGAVLLDQELLHRETCHAKGNILTGCPELDDHVLVGGLARGAVLGLSAEEETFGLLLGLQTIARLLVTGTGDRDASRHPSAMIVTTLSHAELLPTLRSAVKGQVDALPGVHDIKARVKTALERISISRVFDFDGLREALDELDRPFETGQPQTNAEVETSAVGSDDVLEEQESEQEEAEIQDSENEDGLSSPGSPADKSHRSPSPDKLRQQNTSQQRKQPPVPDIVLITNLPALITSLYTTRDRRHAHRMLRHLSSRLRYLSRSPSHGGPLFVLLNSATSKPPLPSQHQPADGAPDPLLRLAQSSAPSASQSPVSSPSHSPSPSDNPILPPQQDLPPRRGESSATTSVFNPPPPNPVQEHGEVDEYGYARHPNPDYVLLLRLSGRNRPYFGLRFEGLVDVHLLATKVPRTDGDAEVYFRGLLGDDGGGKAVDEGIGLVWVIEVLRDGVGVWVEDVEGEDGNGGMGMCEGGGEQTGRMGRRFNREQRWTGVEIRENAGGVRVGDVVRS